MEHTWVVGGGGGGRGRCGADLDPGCWGGAEGGEGADGGVAGVVGGGYDLGMARVTKA